VAVNETINIKVRTDGADKSARDIDKVGKSASSSAAMVGKLVAAMAAVAIGVFLKKSIELANIQEEAVVSLTVALNDLGDETDSLVAKLGLYASQLQKNTTFGDEAILEAQARIAMFIKDEEQIKQVTAAVLDLAAAKGMNLTAAADMVSRSIGTSMNAMSRYGIEVTGAVGSTERFDSAIFNLNKRFAGSAAAKADTYKGKMTQLGNAFGDLQEEVGFVITKSDGMGNLIGGVLLPIIENWTSAVSENRDASQDFVKEGILAIVDGVDLLMGVLADLVRQFESVGLGMDEISEAATVVWNIVNGMFAGLKTGVLAVVASIKAAVAGIDGIRNKFHLISDEELAESVLRSQVANAKLVESAEETGKALIALSDSVVDLFTAREDVSDPHELSNQIRGIGETAREWVNELQNMEKTVNDIGTRKGTGVFVPSAPDPKLEPSKKLEVPVKVKLTPEEQELEDFKSSLGMGMAAGMSEALKGDFSSGLDVFASAFSGSMEDALTDVFDNVIGMFDGMFDGMGDALGATLGAAASIASALMRDTESSVRNNLASVEIDAIEPLSGVVAGRKEIGIGKDQTLDDAFIPTNLLLEQMVMLMKEGNQMANFAGVTSSGQSLANRTA
jgi:archaellum component FlaC